MVLAHSASVDTLELEVCVDASTVKTKWGTLGTLDGIEALGATELVNCCRENRNTRTCLKGKGPKPHTGGTVQIELMK